MKQLTLLIFSSMLLAWGACKKDSTTTASGDYFVFGTAYYGMCVGNCAHLYKIQDSQLYADNMDYVTNETYTFLKAPMSKANYSTAAELLNDFPAYFTAHPDTTFGCPDCHDQGGIHIQKKTGDAVTNWHIDTDTAYQPEPVRAYIAKLQHIVAGLE